MSGAIVLTRDPRLADAVRRACKQAGRPFAIASELPEIADAAYHVEWSEVVIDREHADAVEATNELRDLIGERRVVYVVRDFTRSTPRANVVVHAQVLERALTELAAARGANVPSSAERLLEASVLGSSLDDAIDAASHAIAIAFGAARGIIFEGADQPSSVASDGATFDANAWNQTIDLCRRAIDLGATVVVPSPHEPGACDSYTAVPLATPRGGVGFIGLVATGARAFSAQERSTLRAVSARIGRELQFRAAHDRTAEELERVLGAPGVDPMLGVWNRAALDQLAHGYVAHAKRCKLALAMMAVRVVDLEGVNTRFGMAMGDRLLRRIADALKPALRGEDIVGRYSGTILAVILQGAGADDAQRIAQRVHAVLAERALEAQDGSPVKIATTIGIAPMHERDEASNLLRRTARATKDAPDNVIALLQAPTTFTGRIPQPGETGALPMRATFGGSYRLRHEISRGGMGVVYRADDLALERPVAIKMLRPELAQNEELVKHLRREAALLARVHHPNLVQIYNFGHAEGDCYFVMELVEGETVQQAIERHRVEGAQMPVPDLLAIVDQIASALDALHERGIVHRDVKPANFIRDPFSGRSVLVDVGIAHRFGELSKQAGTPGFMAPEVIQGIPASPRSDVYGLAASVFAMATLTAPWGEGEPIEIIMRQCNETLPRASDVRPELAPIDDLLAQAMTFDVDKRPASAGELAKSLSRALGMIMPAVSSRMTRTRIKPETNGAASAPRTRGIVFQSALRALPSREADRLRDALGAEHADLANALSQTAPLAWAPSELLVQLLELAPQQLSRDQAVLAREIARETVRASFRNFFPASPATLHPDRTLSAIRGIWSRYHTWGNVSSISVNGRETVVRVAGGLKVKAMCEWTSELLKTIVSLSGGRDPVTAHESCEVEGADACAFRVTWHE